MLWRREPKRSRQRQIRILADALQIQLTQYSDIVSGVDYHGEVRSTLPTILWRQEPNRGVQRQIPIFADPFEFRL